MIRIVVQSVVDKPMNSLSVELSAISVWSCNAQRISQHTLEEQILEWQADSDLVIVMADMNKDVQEDQILPWSDRLGLKEAIMAQHGNATPNTHNCSQNPINSIFVPAELLSSIQSGYLAYREGIPSNHHVVWVDIPLGALGWFSQAPAAPLKARWLKCEDLQMVEQYNRFLENKWTRQGLV